MKTSAISCLALAALVSANPRWKSKYQSSDWWDGSSQTSYAPSKSKSYQPSYTGDLVRMDHIPVTLVGMLLWP